MDETNDVHALEKISSEVDESQIKVILSSQCIKAQAFLLDKLRKQSERHKETCNYISSANIKLEAEIKQAELEINRNAMENNKNNLIIQNGGDVVRHPSRLVSRGGDKRPTESRFAKLNVRGGMGKVDEVCQIMNSMLIAQETIRSGNVEIKKECLMAKIRKTDIKERIENGKKKYEALWLECKSRYESIPFVQKLLCVTEKANAIKKDIDGLDMQITALYEDRAAKREICKELDKKRAIELANFFVNEMPEAIELIKKKTNLINDISKEIEEISNKQDMVTDEVVLEVEEPPNPKIDEIQSEKTAKDDSAKIIEDDFMPRLELTNYDIDVIDVSLEKVKIMKNELPKPIQIETNINNLGTNKIDQYREEGKAYDHIISPYFKTTKENSHNYSKRKLINILEDININHNEAYNIVKKVNPEKLHKVNEISSENEKTSKAKDTPVESEDIEEVDMSITEDIIIPPTQFLDISLLCSPDEMTKKRVSFDIPSSVQINEIIEDVNDESESANQTANSQLDVSVASEDSYIKIKDMILKKHNLDLSPQFVYSKKSTLQKMDDDNAVTSKFFPCENQELKTYELNGNKVDEMEVEAIDPEMGQKQEEPENLEAPKSPINNILTMDVDDVMVSSPKENKTSEDQRRENPVSGLLFTHGTQGIPDSLNASMSTTGYEDLEIPNCIDSSLLLSPKADVSLPGDNPEVQSQEVPNFLSGFRKAGLSFFGGPSTSEPKPDPDEQNGANNNFSFNFGGEKKNRGGLFSLFR